MNIKDFFDKDAQIQFDLLTALTEKNHSIKKSSLINTLNISTFVLEKSIYSLLDLFQLLQLNMSIHVHNYTDSVLLEGYNQLDFEKIYYHFANSSINHSILVHLYLNRNFNIQKLSESLSLSTSTTYRHIYQLNKGLKEFHLTIKNGKIKGDDLQLSYFFYQFFWYSLPPSQLKSKISDPELLRFVNLLEKKMDITFTQNSRDRILLWCKIIKGNYSKDVHISNIILNLIDDFQTDPLYIMIKEAYLISQSHTAILGSDYIAAYIYIFLSSAFSADIQLCKIAHSTSSDMWPTRVQNVINLNEQFLDITCSYFGLNKQEIHSRVDPEYKYLLSVTHAGTCYFHGRIEDYMSSSFLVKNHETNIFEDLIQILLEHLEREVQWKLVNTTRIYISWVYQTLIDVILSIGLPSIRIGVALNRSPLLLAAYVDALKKIYKQKEYVKVEAAVMDKYYNILVSDDVNLKHDFTFDRYYSMQEIEKDYTLPLREILNKY
ncbi:helix-turn-helix domain-containing protein [Enterococcus sp. AD013-P3]|uniref:helix-turn-helix domain-containing protein n=1 Tax=Enterococcus sp. AD013-P3 TaxID=3411036 RepID=UPI003B94BDF9